MKHIEKIFSICLIILILSSCAVTKDYERAVSTNSITAYENYQNEFPKSKYKADVEKRLEILYEEQSWNKSVSKNTIYGYQDYLSKYPSGKNVGNARKQIDKIEKQNEINKAWKNAKYENTIESYNSFLD